jgi:hypothetical protein
MKYNYLYKITNLINNKFYIGVHSTNNLDDGYFGSGTCLKNSVNKYGKDNFKKEILEYFDNRFDLLNRENEIVNQNLITEKQCMNLKPGGSGGFINEEHAYKFHAAGGKKVRQMFAARHKERMKTDEAYRDVVIEKMSKNYAGGLKGKNHSIETKEKMKKTRRERKLGIGTKNSQFGTCWINKEGEVKKIKKELLDEYKKIGWKPGRRKLN